MSHVDLSDHQSLLNEIKALAALKAEYGAFGLPELTDRMHQALVAWLAELGRLPENAAQAALEPNALAEIQALRPNGPRRLPMRFDPAAYCERIEGAILARSAGCTLGAIVEGWAVEAMEEWAREIGDPFPPVDYWSQARTPSQLRYATSRCDAYTRTGMDGVPVDDDLVYTQLGLLLLEEHGLQFTTEHVACYWDKYLHWIYTDMEWALKRWRESVSALEAADGNPWQQMICAFIRCDPYGYVVPGWPERAAELSYRDGYLSHRRNGLYGGMFFAATIAAALCLDDPLEAVRVGLSEIPADCALAAAVRWALEIAPTLRDYRDARRAVDERYVGMHTVHTINNACLVIFGLALGGRDVTRVIGHTVAMGMDNDCTAATAGSIVGAIVGRRGVPEHWQRPFQDRMHSYIKGHPSFGISDMVQRYARLAGSALQA